MVASTVKSVNVTKIEANPIQILDRASGGLVSNTDYLAAATTSIDEAADVMLFCPIPSNAIIRDVFLLNDDLDSNASPTLAVDVGLAYSGIGGNQLVTGKTSGTAVDVDCFASAATTLQAAKVVWTSVRFEAANITTAGQEAWQIGGLSADPGGILYVSLKVTTQAATAATGDIVVRVDYI